MRDDDLAYYERRLRQESAWALAAQSPEVQAFHGCLSGLYRQRLDGLRREPELHPTPLPIRAAT